MKGPSCRFSCTNSCWHECFVPLVKLRSQIKGRCDYLLRKKEARRKKTTRTNSEA